MITHPERTHHQQLSSLDSGFLIKRPRRHGRYHSYTECGVCVDSLVIDLLLMDTITAAMTVGTTACPSPTEDILGKVGSGISSIRSFQHSRYIEQMKHQTITWLDQENQTICLQCDELLLNATRGLEHGSEFVLPHSTDMTLFPQILRTRQISFN